MGILLRSHDRAVVVFDFDVRDGRASVLRSKTWKEAQQHSCHGYASRINFKTAALYTLEGRLWFQTGSFKLDLMKPSIQFVWKRTRMLLLNRFAILENQQPCFKCTYFSAAANPLDLLDVAFDGLDEELSDFFLWFCRWSLKPNWQSDMANLLEKGI
jgi:hypothetical protein